MNGVPLESHQSGFSIINDVPFTILIPSIHAKVTLIILYYILNVYS